MEALIRSARLGSSRTRLSDAVAEIKRGPEVRRDEVRTPSVEEVLRERVEKQVRAECAAEMKRLYESEHARARAEGQAAAVLEARAAANKEVETTREELRADFARAIATLEQAHESALAKLESCVGELAFAALCRLVNPQLATRAFALDVIERTCAEVRAETSATARLHPRDVELLSDLFQDGQGRIRSLGVNILADDSLTLGGCVIEVSSGQYDGGIESQLRRLHAALTAEKEYA
jgi:flagellar assembly protein FliH